MVGHMCERRNAREMWGRKGAERQEHLETPRKVVSVFSVWADRNIEYGRPTFAFAHKEAQPHAQMCSDKHSPPDFLLPHCLLRRPSTALSLCGHSSFWTMSWFLPPPTSSSLHTPVLPLFIHLYFISASSLSSASSPIVLLLLLTLKITTLLRALADLSSW